MDVADIVLSSLWTGCRGWTILISIAFVCLAGCTRERSFPSGRLVQRAGKFSFVTPDGWLRTKVPALDYVVVSTRPDLGVAPNIFVDAVRESIDLDRAGVVFVTDQLRQFSSYRVTETNAFKTQTGLAARKIIAERVNKDGLRLSVFHYMFQDGGRVVCISCTCAADVREKYEGIFDLAMKSVQSELTPEVHGKVGPPGVD